MECSLLSIGAHRVDRGRRVAAAVREGEVVVVQMARTLWSTAKQVGGMVAKVAQEAPAVKVDRVAREEREAP
jgi:hypothetical protein